MLSVRGPVYHPVEQVGLGGVHPRDAGAPGGSRLDVGWDKPQKRPRLRQDDVRQVGKAGVRLPCGWVGQDGDEGKLLLVKAVDCKGGLGHLHQ